MVICSCTLAGFSDPYCMLGIQPGNRSPKGEPPVNQDSYEGSASFGASHEERRDSLIACTNQIERLKKHTSFRISFKRKEHSQSSLGSNGSSRGSISGASGATGIIAGASGGSNSSIRDQRESLHAALPAKFIRATSVKAATLNPKWGEKFRL